MKLKDEFVYFVSTINKEYILNKKYIILIERNKKTGGTKITYEKPGDPPASLSVSINENFDEIMEILGF